MDFGVQGVKAHLCIHLESVVVMDASIGGKNAKNNLTIVFFNRGIVYRKICITLVAIVPWTSTNSVIFIGLQLKSCISIILLCVKLYLAVQIINILAHIIKELWPGELIKQVQCDATFVLYICSSSRMMTPNWCVQTQLYQPDKELHSSKRLPNFQLVY